MIIHVWRRRSLKILGLKGSWNGNFLCFMVPKMTFLALLLSFYCYKFTSSLSFPHFHGLHLPFISFWSIICFLLHITDSCLNKHILKIQMGWSLSSIGYFLETKKSQITARHLLTLMGAYVYTSTLCMWYINWRLYGYIKYLQSLRFIIWSNMSLNSLDKFFKSGNCFFL